MSLPATARAAVMTAPREPLELREYPLSPAPPGGAVVRVTCCTICRSDLHTWLGNRASPAPIILGHEIVGTIAELGSGLTHDMRDRPLAVGDRVTWTLHSSCGRCHYCVDRQLPMKCRALRKYGHDACDAAPHFLGGFAEYCIVDAGTSILKLPPSMPDPIAAPANCATATIMAACEAAGLRGDHAVLIQGAGGLGCYAAAVAARAGCSRIIATDVDERRLEFIRRFGATDCINVSSTPADVAVEQIRSATDGFGVDVALELAGAPAAVGFGLAALAVGGCYVEVGCSFAGACAAIDMSTILWKRLTLTGVHNYDARHLRQAVDFLEMAQSHFPLGDIVGAQFPLDQINDAIRVAETGAFNRVAILP
jgi:putative phosphonate catabolism associated alcohol dehydrogenase